MDIYGTNMNLNRKNIDHKLLRYYVIITIQNVKK